MNKFFEVTEGGDKLMGKRQISIAVTFTLALALCAVTASAATKTVIIRVTGMT